MKKAKEILKILAAQAITILAILALIEVVGQLYAYSNPGYETLSAIPDKTVGWRLTPNLEYIHTGGHWYADEFSVEIKHNSLGFRDNNRNIITPPNTTRIAVLGDSFVAAKQVPFQNTPGQVLEQLLNQNSKTEQKQNYEVLNFGIGGIGIGQSFLAYRQYARSFNPDYVFLFIFEGDIWRTIAPLSAITNNLNTVKNLAIRPTFNVSNKNAPNVLQPLLQILNLKSFYELLVKLKTQKYKSGEIPVLKEDEYISLINTFNSLITEEKIEAISQKLNQLDLFYTEPSQNNFDKFVQIQAERTQTDFGEDRTRVRKHKVFLVSLWRRIVSGLSELKKMADPELSMKEELNTLIKTYGPRNPYRLFDGNPNYPNFEKVVFINLKVLERLNSDIINDGRKFVIVDASSHLVKYGRLPASLLSTILEKYCKVNAIGYIPLYQPLNKARRNGAKTTWSKDGHFNENGYRIFGEAMFQWIEAHKG